MPFDQFDSQDQPALPMAPKPMEVAEGTEPGSETTPGQRAPSPVGSGEQARSSVGTTADQTSASGKLSPSATGTTADQTSASDEPSAQKTDFLTGDSPEALILAARDLSDLGSFAYAVSDDGRNPEKLIDAVKMLLLIQEEEYATGGGVGGHIGLDNRFKERWGAAPKADPSGFLTTCHRLSLINKDVSVQLTTKGSRLLGTVHRVLQDWYGFHRKNPIEQLLFQSQREIELMDAYEGKGYEAGSLNRALSFLEKGYRDVERRLYDYIMEGVAIEQITSILDRYDFLQGVLDGQKKQGFRYALPIVDRVEKARTGALGVAFKAMTGVLSHSTGKALSEMNLINKTKFYNWLGSVFAGDRLLELAGEAGDVTLPIYLPGFPSYDQLEEFVADTLGREHAAPGAIPPEPEVTSSIEGDLDSYEEGEFDEDFAPYVDWVLASLPSEGEVRESQLLKAREGWADILMSAAAAGEVVTKGMALGRHSRETFESEKLVMLGEILIRRKSQDSRQDRALKGGDGGP